MSTAHSIRVARPEDFEALSSLLLASYSTLLAGHYDHDLLETALPFMTRANPALLASGTYYVAESGNDVIGCGGWSAGRPGSGETSEGEAYIRHIASHPEWLGRGVGRSLLSRCVREARPLVHTLHCFSTRNAEPFYRACGFATIGPMDVPMGPTLKFPAVRMKRELD